MTMVIVALCKLARCTVSRDETFYSSRCIYARCATALCVQQSYFAMLTIISNNWLHIERLNKERCILLNNKTLLQVSFTSDIVAFSAYEDKI